ncbi:hypothetical protein DWY02_13975 [Eubacterium sp. AF22-9]|nr:hypothetical protein DWY02_13975 [Eubacterium sp. AF22-9]
MMIFVLITFMEEFENNMFLQIRGSKNSRKVLPVKRCLIILLISIVLSFVLMVSFWQYIRIFMAATWEVRYRILICLICSR